MKRLFKTLLTSTLALTLWPMMSAQAGSISTQTFQLLTADHTTAHDIQMLRPSGFDGTYLSFGLGNTNVTVDSNAHFEIAQPEPTSPVIFDSPSKDEDHDFNLNLALGYGKVFHQYIYLGGEVFLQYFLSNNEITITKYVSESGKELINISTNSLQYGATGKLGYTLAKNIMIYLSLGIAQTTFKVKSHRATESAPSLTTSKSMVQLMPGIGAEANITDRWSINAEYRYINHQKAKLAMIPEPSDITIDPAMHILSIGAIYRW